MFTRLLLGLTGVVWLCLPATAHDYWLDPGDFDLAVGSHAEILLCNGHSFPERSTDTHGYIIHETVVIKPGGDVLPLTVETGDNGKSTKCVFETNGMHMVCLSMKGSKQKDPSYWVRALVFVGDPARTDGTCQTGKGMEIVPGSGVSGLKVDDTLSLSVVYDGRRIRALVTITREDGRVSHIRSSPRRPAMFRIKKPGKYLVVASVAGKKCSLTFAVGERRTDSGQSGRK